jgi:hypothetical protein
MSRQNKANKNMRIQAVSVQSVLRPFKVDNILNFKIRYQALAIVAGAGRMILRSMLLNTLLVNPSSTTLNIRICAAVRINRIDLTTSIGASLEWLSELGPSSATNISGTSTTAPGYLSQRPPNNSLASFWSRTGSAETVPIFALTCQINDYIDVSYSVVLFDQETAVTVTTTNGGAAGQLYRTFLDGPTGAAQLSPLYCLSIN